MDPEGSLLSSH